jgi:hypothetical protein
MRIRFLIIAALTVAANSVEAQQPRGLRGWSFGPIGPHVTDASKRTALSVAWGAAFMGLGLGIDALNRQSCSGGAACFSGNPVQAGIGYGFLGAIIGSTGPQFHSKCTRSGRAVLAITGAVIGTGLAALATDSRMFSARRDDPATWKVMGGGLLGMSAGAGIVTAIC